MTMADDTIAA